MPDEDFVLKEWWVSLGEDEIGSNITIIVYGDLTRARALYMYYSDELFQQPWNEGIIISISKIAQVLTSLPRVTQLDEGTMRFGSSWIWFQRLSSFH